MSDGDFFDDIATRFGTARKAMGLSQIEVAQMVGMNRNRYAELERGVRSDALFSTVINIARALRMDIMMVPVELVPAVNALVREDVPEDSPMFGADPENDDEPEHDNAFSR